MVIGPAQNAGWSTRRRTRIRGSDEDLLVLGVFRTRRHSDSSAGQGSGLQDLGAAGIGGRFRAPAQGLVVQACTVWPTCIAHALVRMPETGFTEVPELVGLMKQYQPEFTVRVEGAPFATVYRMH
jgi:hypothetical protein